MTSLTESLTWFYYIKLKCVLMFSIVRKLTKWVRNIPWRLRFFILMEKDDEMLKKIILTSKRHVHQMKGLSFRIKDVWIFEEDTSREFWVKNLIPCFQLCSKNFDEILPGLDNCWHTLRYQFQFRTRVCQSWHLKRKFINAIVP